MSFIGNFLYILLVILQWAILIRVLLSWLPMAGIQIDPSNPVIKLLHDLTDPILNPLRRFATIGMMDLSPIIAFFLISFLMKIVGSMF